MNEPLERRKHPRKTIPPILKVYDLNTGKHLGSLVNISLGGVMMVTPLDVQANSVYQLRILHDDHGRSAPITFGGEILWTEKTTNPDKRWAGIQIIDISEEMKIRLAQLIHDEP